MKNLMQASCYLRFSHTISSRFLRALHRHIPHSHTHTHTHTHTPMYGTTANSSGNQQCVGRSSRNSGAKLHRSQHDVAIHRRPGSVRRPCGQYWVVSRWKRQSACTCVRNGRERFFVSDHNIRTRGSDNTAGNTASNLSALPRLLLLLLQLLLLLLILLLLLLHYYYYYYYYYYYFRRTGLLL